MQAPAAAPPYCYCCLAPRKGFWVHTLPGDGTPPSAGQVPPAIAEEGGRDRLMVQLDWHMIAVHSAYDHSGRTHSIKFT